MLPGGDSRTFLNNTVQVLNDPFPGNPPFSCPDVPPPATNKPGRMQISLRES